MNTDKGGASPPLLPSFTPRQWTFLAVFGLANIFRAVSILIGGPFYPPEAKDRGLSDSEIGFIFGIYDLATFSTCLLFGKLIIPKLGPRLVLFLSTINLGLCTIAFGCLELTEDKTLYLTLSFVIRALAGAGDAGFYPSAFTIFALEFPTNVSTAIGLFEFLFGVGAIVGPLVLGAIIDDVGFLVVYTIVGVLLLGSGGLIWIGAPPEEEVSLSLQQLEEEVVRSEGGRPWYDLFKIPPLLLVIFNLFSAAASIGFITATLETHLEQFELSSLETSAAFIVSNTIYTVLSPAWGQLSDRKPFGFGKNLVLISGSLLIGMGFSFLGPLPFLHNQSVLWMSLVGLGIHGVGLGGAIMSSFPFATDAVIGAGFEKTSKTYSLISSVYTLTFTLGNSLGPSLAGVLVDHVGFQWATLFIPSLSLTTILLTLLLAGWTRVRG